MSDMRPPALTPYQMRVLRGAHGNDAYRPAIIDWMYVEECVELGLLEVHDLEADSPGSLPSFAYRLTAAGQAVMTRH